MRVNEQSLCDPRKKTLTIQAKNVCEVTITYINALTFCCCCR